jgi:hypothetical protein
LLRGERGIRNLATIKLLYCNSKFVIELQQVFLEEEATVVVSKFYRCIDKTKEIMTTLFIRNDSSVNITRIFRITSPQDICSYKKKTFPPAVFFNWPWLTPERAGRCTLEVTQLLKKLQLLLCITPPTVSGKGGVVLVWDGGRYCIHFPSLTLKKQTILPLARMNVILMLKNPFYYF